MKKHKVIITGSTGMVGEGILHICLNSDLIETVLVVNRKPLGLSHPKLKEIIHTDFYDLTSILDEFRSYDACFFCLGISSVGANKDYYFKTTYTLTLHFAESVLRVNNKIKFMYVSGAGTDETETGRVAWAKVKGKTENDLAKMTFDRFYAFRPGFIKPIKNLRFTHSFYKYINWFFPIGRSLYPSAFCTMEELGNAMLFLLENNFSSTIVKGKDIIKLSASYNIK